VVEVTKAGYDACSGGNPIKSYTDGSTTVKLTTPDDHYFICTVPGHCASGMKLKVTVIAAAAATPAPTKSTKPSSGVAPATAPADEEAPATTSTPETSTPTAVPAPKLSDAATVVGAKAVMALAASVALAMAMWGSDRIVPPTHDSFCREFNYCAAIPCCEELVSFLFIYFSILCPPSHLVISPSRVYMIN
jgi:hypothetical protein